MKEELKQKADNYYFKKYTRTLNIGEEERQKAIKEAYIAGATENQPNTEEMLKRLSKAGIIINLFTQHDLRKDPNDLPKEVKNGRSKVVYGDKGEPIYFSYKTNWWKDYSDHERYPPVAWCEIPQFKEIKEK